MTKKAPNRREYKNLVFTDHALQRMKLRRITEAMIASAVQKPDDKVLESDGDTRFIRAIKNRPLHVVSAYLPDENKWLVKSVWVRGEDDPEPWWKILALFPLRLLQNLVKPDKRRRK
jgi:hypothetical protein